MMRSATLRRVGSKAFLTGHFDRSQRLKTVVPFFENPKASSLCALNKPVRDNSSPSQLTVRNFSTVNGLDGGTVITSAVVGEKDAPISLYGSSAGDAAREPGTEHKSISVTSLRAKHKKGEAISMITAYDYPSAKAADAAGIDIILVGDSVGMVVLGYDSTTPVTMDEMLHHCKAVARGTNRPFLVGDLPFGSYINPNDAVTNAVRLVKDGSMSAVKLEGGKRMCASVEAIADAGINVMGHIGLTPQTATSLGGYRVQGKSAQAAQSLLEDALALQEAGCHAIVLECVPDRIAAHVTDMLRIPTIGIGAGPHVSGQVCQLNRRYRCCMDRRLKTVATAGTGVA